jgi:hypothetical protein
MNIDRMEQLARAFEADTLPLKFDMASFHYITECGTFACIAGQAVEMFEPKSIGLFLNFQIAELARSLLDLNGEQANRLFFQWPVKKSRDKAAAARRIRTEMRIERAIEAAS